MTTLEIEAALTCDEGDCEIEITVPDTDIKFKIPFKKIACWAILLDLMAAALIGIYTMM